MDNKQVLSEQECSELQELLNDDNDVIEASTLSEEFQTILLQICTGMDSIKMSFIFVRFKDNLIKHMDKSNLTRKIIKEKWQDFVNICKSIEDFQRLESKGFGCIKEKRRAGRLHKQAVLCYLCYHKTNKPETQDSPCQRCCEQIFKL